MQLITAKCPDCGAGLKIPEGSSSVVCEFCGSQVMVTDVLGTGAVMQNCMILAYAALKDDNYKEALDHFNRALEIDMKSSSAWFGRAMCTGWLCIVAKPGFDDMMTMFESAINYAAEDKRANIKKNAAVETVKAVRHIMPNIRFGVDMIEMEMDDKDNDMVKSTLDIINNVKNTKEQINRALDKCKEYDPANTDVAAAQNEVNAIVVPEMKGAGVKLDPKQQFAIADQELSKVQASGSAQSTQSSTKKSGCSMMIAVAIVITGLSAYLLSIVI